jgi:hypothetical protein
MSSRQARVRSTLSGGSDKERVDLFRHQSTTLPTKGGNPILDRRAKIIARLEEQKLIPKDPNKSQVVRKDGERVMVEQEQRVPLWWRQHPNGSYALFVRSGLKPIEFEKGKPAIAVSSLDKLLSVIDTLITAVRTGELDQQFAETSIQEARESPSGRRDEGNGERFCAARDTAVTDPHLHSPNPAVRTRHAALPGFSPKHCVNEQ